MENIRDTECDSYDEDTNRRSYSRRIKDNERTITDKDIDAIIIRLEEKFTRFLGRAIWAAVQKVFITFVVAVLAYGFVFKDLLKSLGK